MKYEEALSDKAAQEEINFHLQNDVKRRERNMVSSIGSIVRLVETHAKPSLSGGFAESVKRAIQTLQWNLDDLREHQADMASVQGIDDGLTRIRRALRPGAKAKAGAGTNYKSGADRAKDGH